MKYKDRYVLATGYPCMRGRETIEGTEFIGMVPHSTDTESKVKTIHLPMSLFDVSTPRYRLVLERVKDRNK
jgi:hypothetical protein